MEVVALHPPSLAKSARASTGSWVCKILEFSFTSARSGEYRNYENLELSPKVPALPTHSSPRAPQNTSAAFFSTYVAERVARGSGNDANHRRVSSSSPQDIANAARHFSQARRCCSSSPTWPLQPPPPVDLRSYSRASRSPAMRGLHLCHRGRRRRGRGPCEVMRIRPVPCSPSCSRATC